MNDPSVPNFEPAAAPTEAAAAPKAYGRSVLLAASVRYWRAAGVLLLVVLANAIVQSVLVAVGVIPLLNSATFWILAVTSMAIMILAASLIATAALGAAQGRISIRETIATAVPNLGWFTLWSAGWAIFILVGLSIYTWPGLIILAITPYLPLAAAAGARNPVRANFLAIRARFGRYIEVLIFSVAILGLSRIAAALFNFLIFGGPASFATMLLSGLIISWLAVAWALVYRSTPVGRAVRVEPDRSPEMPHT